MDEDDSLARDLLQQAGLDPTQPLTARHGWSNQAWLGSVVVVRISNGRLRGSFAHEARVEQALRGVGLPLPEVLATSSRGDVSGEWIVTRRLAGLTLAEAWPSLDADARRSIGRQLGASLRALHGSDIDLAPGWWVDAQEPANFHNAYRPPVAVTPPMIQGARARLDADAAMLDEVDALLAERLPLFHGDAHVFVHADVHGHNLLVDGDRLSGILDWEGAHSAPADVDLDMLLRWCAAAHEFPERPGATTVLEPGDVLPLVDHVREGYHQLFEGPHLRERLEVYEVQWQLVQLHFDAYWRALGHEPEFGDDPHPGWAGLRRVLDGTTHLRMYDL